MVNNMKTVVLLGLLGGLFVALGWLFGGRQGALFALGFAALFNFGMYFFSDRIALASSRARPVEEHELPNVYTTVRSLAQREDMPMPRIYLIDSPQPNAFATGRNPRHAAVAVTTGILEMMSHQELEGVLAHELSHVRNRDILIATIAATIGAAMSFMARMAFWGGMGGRRDENNSGIGMVVGLIAMIIAPLVAAMIQLAISRSREYQADRSGAESTGSPLALASALAKLDAGTRRFPMAINDSTAQLFIADPLKALEGRRSSNWMGRMFSTHPPIAERIERLEEMSMGIR
ncbi:MAG: protease HtpX [Actinobacteria bacterium]|nr:MAG: protease HtpX [Actinomycetota bacterium]